MPKTHHAVFLKIKPDCGDAEIHALFTALAALKEKIPGIVEFSGGPNSSPENLTKGFTHGFAMVFESEAARDAYLPHPDHLAVVGMILPMLDGDMDGVTVLDWNVD